jgi:TatD DNase family protein
MWIDSHAHLFVFSEDDLNRHITQARNENVGTVLSTATDCITARTVATQCKSYEIVWGAVGISPFDVVDPPDQWRAEIISLLSHPKIIAVGETGIDTTNPRYPELSLQQPMFEEQLEIARIHNLPAIIHSRGAEEKTCSICRRQSLETAVFHCFTGDKKALKAILDAGYFVSLSGIVTFLNSDLRNLVKYIPVDRLLIETDTPYLAPVPFRGKTNRPAWVAPVGEAIAEITGKPVPELQRQLTVNFQTVFRKFSLQQQSVP